MKQTAVEWFYFKLLISKEGDNKTIMELFEQAKEMQKEQKIAFANEYSSAVIGGCLLTPSEFYNETFKSQ